MKLIKPLYLSAIISLSSISNVHAGFSEGEAAYKEDDYVTALNEFSLLAEQGHAKALYRLSQMYIYGEGVERDKAKGYELLLKAAKRGHTKSIYSLAIGYHYGLNGEKNLKKASELYHEAAENGDPASQHTLGFFYRKGIGVERNFETAFKWYLKSAEQGYSTSSFHLYEMYSKGEGVEKDKEQATQWLLKSANDGPAGRKHIVAKVFEKGQDYELAERFYRIAAEQGYEDSQFELGQKYLRGRGVNQDYNQAERWYRKAAEQGHTNAQFELANLYKDGLGIKKDYEQAKIWYEKAAPTNRLAKKELDYIDCLQSDGTTLFGIGLKCADRDMMREQIKNAGGVVIRENDEHWGDSYSSENLLNGSTELYVSYSSSNNKVALARYKLPSRMDTHQVVKIRNMIASKYGEPSRSSGRPSVGEVVYMWYLPDGFNLAVARGWPDTTTYIAYKEPEIFAAQQAEVKRQKAKREANEYAEQEANF